MSRLFVAFLMYMHLCFELAFTNSCPVSDCVHVLLGRVLSCESNYAAITEQLVELQRETEYQKARLDHVEKTNQVLNETVTYYKARLNELEEKDNSHDTEFNKVPQLTVGNRTTEFPAFTVRLSVEVTFTKAEIRVIFDEVLTNPNNSYDVATGQFIAPIAGKYLFSLTVRNYKDQDANAKIQKNGDLIGVAISKGESSWGGTGSVSVVLDLIIGDVVDVVTTRNVTQVFQSKTCLFMGYFIYHY